MTEEAAVHEGERQTLLAQMKTPAKNEMRKPLTPVVKKVVDDLGGFCPTCGQAIKPPPLTGAERQKRYRERKRNGQ